MLINRNTTEKRTPNPPRSIFRTRYTNTIKSDDEIGNM